MASRKSTNLDFVAGLVFGAEKAVTSLASRQKLVGLLASLAFLSLAVILSSPFWLGLIPLALLSFFRPSEVVLALAVFVPFKSYLRSLEFLPAGILTWIVPVTLAFAYLGFMKERREPEGEASAVYLFLIFLASVFSTLGSAILYGFRSAQFLDFLVWFQLVGFYLVGREWLSRPRSIEKFAFLNLGVMNLVSFWAMAQAFFLKGTPNWVERYELIRVRASGPLGNPNALAGYLLLGLAVCLVVWARKRAEGYGKAWLLGGILPLLAFALTFSRSALIVFFLALASLAIYKKLYLELGIAAIMAGLLFLAAPTAYRKRLTNIFSSDHLSFSADSGRLWALRNVFYINRNHLLFGSGWGSYGGEYAYGSASPTYLEGVQDGVVGVANTDNQWLQVYAQQGAVGLWLYALLFLGLAKVRAKNPLLIPLLMYVALGFFVDVFQFYQVSFLGWMVMGSLSGKEKDV